MYITITEEVAKVMGWDFNWGKYNVNWRWRKSKLNEELKKKPNSNEDIKQFIFQMGSLHL